MKRVFILAHETARRRAQEYIWDAPDGYRVEVSEPKKKRAQEENLYARTATQVKIDESVKLLQSDTDSNQTTSVKGHHG